MICCSFLGQVLHQVFLVRQNRNPKVQTDFRKVLVEGQACDIEAQVPRRLIRDEAKKAGAGRILSHCIRNKAEGRMVRPFPEGLSQTNNGIDTLSGILGMAGQSKHGQAAICQFIVKAKPVQLSLQISQERTLVAGLGRDNIVGLSSFQLQISITDSNQFGL